MGEESQFQVLKETAGQNFYNTSKFVLTNLQGEVKPLKRESKQDLGLIKH